MRRTNWRTTLARAKLMTMRRGLPALPQTVSPQQVGLAAYLLLGLCSWCPHLSQPYLQPCLYTS